MTIHSFPDMRVLDVNEAYERRTGLTRDQAVGKTAHELGLWADPDALKRAIRKLGEDGRLYNFEVHFRDRAGQDVNALASSEVVEFADGRYVLSILEDVSLRKRAEEALRVCDTKFQRVFQEAGVGMVIGSPDLHFIAANQAFCQMLGYSEGELFDKTFRSIMHPDDRLQLRRALNQAVEDGSKFYRVEGRYLHKNGNVVWTENTASLTRNPDGTLQYFVAEIVDITARKKAENTVASLSGRLIQAQEDERRYFARELHDDIGQRVALVIMDLEKLLDRDFDSEDRRRRAVQNLVSRTKELSQDLHNLSRRLHSSKLEHVGLVPAIKAFFAERERQGLEVNFIHHDVPEGLPWKVSIALFRVLQEALANALKYSGVRKFEVRLDGAPREITLSFRDSGVGFDVEKAKWKGGLGLVSMEERVKLLGGTISIVSGPTSGILVSVRIPIAQQASAAADTAPNPILPERVP